MRDERTLEITINGRYPQFVFWLAMPFFAPIAPEIDRFYHNPGFAERNLTLDWWPVGSGPYMVVENDPNSAIVLERIPTTAKISSRRRARRAMPRRACSPMPASAFLSSIARCFGLNGRAFRCGPNFSRVFMIAPVKHTHTPPAFSTRRSSCDRRAWRCRRPSGA